MAIIITSRTGEKKVQKRIKPGVYVTETFKETPVPAGGIAITKKSGEVVVQYKQREGVFKEESFGQDAKVITEPSGKQVIQQVEKTRTGPSTYQGSTVNVTQTRPIQPPSQKYIDIRSEPTRIAEGYKKGYASVQDVQKVLASHRQAQISQAYKTGQLNAGQTSELLHQSKLYQSKGKKPVQPLTTIQKVRLVTGGYKPPILVGIDTIDTMATSLTEPAFQKLEETEEKAGIVFTWGQPGVPFVKATPVTKAVYGFEKGMIKEVIQKPAQVTATFLVGGVIGKGAATLRYAHPAVYKTASSILAGWGLGSLAAGTILSEKPGEFLGKSAVYATAFMTGAHIGAKEYNIKVKEVGKGATSTIRKGVDLEEKQAFRDLTRSAQEYKVGKIKFKVIGIGEEKGRSINPELYAIKGTQYAQIKTGGKTFIATTKTEGVAASKIATRLQTTNLYKAKTGIGKIKLTKDLGTFYEVEQSKIFPTSTEYGLTTSNYLSERYSVQPTGLIRTKIGVGKIVETWKIEEPILTASGKEGTAYTLSFKSVDLVKGGSELKSLTSFKPGKISKIIKYEPVSKANIKSVWTSKELASIKKQLDLNLKIRELPEFTIPKSSIKYTGDIGASQTGFARGSLERFSAILDSDMAGYNEQIGTTIIKVEHPMTLPHSIGISEKAVTVIAESLRPKTVIPIINIPSQASVIKPVAEFKYKPIISKQELNIGSSYKFGQSSIMKQKSFIEQKSFLEQKPILEQKSFIEQKSFLEQKPILEQKSILEQKPILESKFFITPRPIIPTPPPVVPPVVPPIGLPNLYSTKKYEKSFNVFVRKKGVFTKISRVPLTYKGAIGLGIKITGGTALASFKISEAEGKPAKLGYEKYYNRLYQYRKPIRKGREIVSGIYIEKNKFRIDTGGELKEITYKGLFSKKRKKFMRRLKI